jgi:chemotaxis protein histidine kinase CheA
VDLTEFLGEFQLEAGEKLDLIASQLLRLERDVSNPQPVREMFLAAHTIKGGAAMMRLTEVEALAHAVEDLLSAIRDQHRPLDGGAVDLLFQAIDRLRALVTVASSASVGAEPDEAVLAFAALLREPAANAAPPAPAVKRTALVVEDSATVRELERLLLLDAGYEVEACAEVSRAGLERFAVVVCGVQSGGFGLCGAHPCVVLTSADVDAELSRRATQAGAKALVRKGSVRASELATVIAGISG